MIIHVKGWHSGEERTRIRVLRILEESSGLCHLDDPTEVHDRDPVRDLTHCAQVMADEQI
ncbi:uncharacterized protein METZ01_LOCUS87876 [marine metagenome]|uniref:Uncharacterized protein n=1 Tax=marine metagenome TaxID=408172 RepID=A0A381V3T3_9ZZZZ